MAYSRTPKKLVNHFVILLDIEVRRPRIHAPCSVIIKGTPSSEAVLCTDSTTYALRLVETTNSLLLAPALEVKVRPPNYPLHYMAPATVNLHVLELQSIRSPCNPSASRGRPPTRPFSQFSNIRSLEPTKEISELGRRFLQDIALSAPSPGDPFVVSMPCTLHLPPIHVH
jgi:hypothetical protein